jgi:hypothetical protein
MNKCKVCGRQAEVGHPDGYGGQEYYCALHEPETLENLWTGPPDGERSGGTYDSSRDKDRLNRQARMVWLVMADGEWHTLSGIAARTGQPEASISARLRDLRKRRFGSHIIARRYVADGLHEYRWEGRRNLA